MSEEEMHEIFGDEDPFSDFFRTFFGGGGGARGRTAARQGAGAAVAEGARHRARGRADARGRVSRRDAPRLDQAGRPRAHRRRPHSGRRQGRLARPRRRRRGTGGSGGASGDLYLRVRLKPHPVFERKGNDLHAKVAVPVTTAVLGGEAQVPTITGDGAPQDSGDDAERPGLPAEGPRHAGGRQARRARRPLRDGRGPAPRTLTPGTARALRGAEEARTDRTEKLQARSRRS